MILANQKLATTPLISSDENVLRARRAWFLVDVVFLTWAFFCVYLWARGYSVAAQACQVLVLCYMLIRLMMGKSESYKAIVHVYLFCSGLGLFLVAVSDVRLELNSFFFPISIVICSYLFGVKQASVWYVISLIHFTAFFCFAYGIDETFTNRIDELVACFGVATCTFFCCQQAEASYRSQAKRMADFSSALKKRSDELELLATTDSLTGLTNRYQFQNILDALVDVATENNKIALFLIDMDGFKEINDTLGHVTGDEVLIEVGKRLSANPDPNVSVARLGGDEFCVLFSGIAETADADQIAKNLVATLTARYELKEVEVTLGTSVGYAIWPDHAQSGEHFLSFADTAMYHAKHNKLDVACYQPEMTDRLSSARTMNQKLADALEYDEFYLVYQPQIDTTTNKVIGAEALLRWSFDGKDISPAVFVPLLENRGRIIPVSNWVVRQVCQQQARWKQQGLDIVVAVNISALQFADDDFVDSLIRPMREFDVAPEKLEIEITEGILIENVNQVIQKLKQLKQLGIRVSIDDFGTGYSSLAYLRQLPLDKLKIDRAFVKGIPDNDEGAIAGSIIMLSDLLNLEVIAEGVETIEQIEFLKENGCNQFQGYFYSKPVFSDKIVAFANSVPSPSAQLNSKTRASS